MDDSHLPGFSGRWQALFSPHAGENTALGRVIRADRGSVLVVSSVGVIRAQPATALVKAVSSPTDLPVVGDWVVMHSPPGLDVPVIDAVLERSSAITRGDPGKQSIAQVLAANVDTVFLVHPIDAEPNLRRIERELSMVWDSGAVPVVVLTKSDAAEDPDEARDEVEAVAVGVDVLVTSSLEGVGVDALLQYVSGERTAVLLGPSGAGKSTLVNTLLGEDRQATREVRMGDGKGRHTTVTRELIPLPSGGVLIDTPGLRALGLTGSEEGIAMTFPEIEEAALSCRFRDCAHKEEPGCAVQNAVRTGAIPASRLESYHKLQREAEFAAMKTDFRLREEEVRKWKAIRKASRALYKRRGRK